MAVRSSTPRRLSLALLFGILICSTLACRYAIAVAGRAVDLVGIGYIPIFFAIANFSTFPGVLGTSISWNRPKGYWLWWIPTIVVGIATTALWIVPCREPSVMKPSPGPLAMPSLFPIVLGILVIGSWLIFFAIAFGDIARRAVTTKGETAR